MNKLLLSLLLLLLPALPALAQNEYPRAELFLGYSYARADLIVTTEDAHGWEASLTGNFHRHVGVEAGFSGHYGHVSGVGFQNNLFLFGPRFATRYDKVTPWGHTLFGVANSKILGASSNDFSFAVGGGVDVKVHDRVALRVIQADYVYIRDVFDLGNSHDLRLSFGVVFQF